MTCIVVMIRLFTSLLVQVKLATFSKFPHYFVWSSSYNDVIERFRWLMLIFLHPPLYSYMKKIGLTSMGCITKDLNHSLAFHHCIALFLERAIGVHNAEKQQQQQKKNTEVFVQNCAISVFFFLKVMSNSVMAALNMVGGGHRNKRRFKDSQVYTLVCG